MGINKSIQNKERVPQGDIRQAIDTLKTYDLSKYKELFSQEGNSVGLLDLLPWLSKANFTDKGLEELIGVAQGYVLQKLTREVNSSNNQNEADLKVTIAKIKLFLDKKESPNNDEQVPPNDFHLKEKNWPDLEKESARLEQLKQRVDKCLEKDNLQTEKERSELAQILLKHIEGQTSEQIAAVLAKFLANQIYLEEFIGAPVFQLKMEQEVRELVNNKSVPKDRYTNRPRNQGIESYVIKHYSKYLKKYNKELSDDAIYLDDLRQIEPKSLADGLSNYPDLIKTKAGRVEKLFFRNEQLTKELSTAAGTIKKRTR